VTPCARRPGVRLPGQNLAPDGGIGLAGLATRSDGLALVQRPILDPLVEAATRARPGFTVRPVPDLNAIFGMLRRRLALYLCGIGTQDQDMPTIP